MSAIIIGGNECMGRTYRDLCAKYNITRALSPSKRAALPTSSVIRITSSSVWTLCHIPWSSARKRRLRSTARSLSNCVAAAHPRWNVS